MALVKCPECTGMVSDKASDCPHCGFPLGQALTTTQRQFPPDPLSTDSAPTTAAPILAAGNCCICGIAVGSRALLHKNGQSFCGKCWKARPDYSPWAPFADLKPPDAVAIVKGNCTATFVVFILCLFGWLFFILSSPIRSQMPGFDPTRWNPWDAFRWMLALSILGGALWSVIFLPTKWTTIRRLQTHHKPLALFGGFGLVVLLLIEVLLLISAVRIK